MHSIPQYQSFISESLNRLLAIKEPQNLYEPVSYILSLGGKRLRPVLTLMTAEIFGTSYKKALDAALAVEVFHNFSLVHDDIMDVAPLRRGKATVHEKWDVNTGILSGDAMLIMAYRLFENYEDSTFRKLAQLFSKTALEVCEGQQYDIDFEAREDVTIPEYLKMIEYKTAVLVAAAMKMGSIIADAPEQDQNNIYQFGKNLGLAFQLQDDYLDAFGNPDTFGKQLGGDIIQNKKTYLYLKAVELANNDQKERLRDLFVTKPMDPARKIESVKELFQNTGAAENTRDEIENYTQKAFDSIQRLGVSDAKKELFQKFGKDLMMREV